MMSTPLPANKGKEPWSEIKTVELEFTVPLTKEIINQTIKSDWLVGVNGLDPAPSIQISIGYFKCPIKVLDVVISGSTTRKIGRAGLRHPLHIRTGSDKIYFIVNAPNQTAELATL